MDEWVRWFNLWQKLSQRSGVICIGRPANLRLILAPCNDAADPDRWQVLVTEADDTQV